MIVFPRRESGVELEVWPLIADFFVGVLGIVVVLYSGVVKPPPDRVAFIKSVTASLEKAKTAGGVERVEVSEFNVRIVYTADRLSFAPCRWDLGPDQAELLRSHLRVFGPGRKWVEKVRIEGHADRDSVYNCPGIVPYRDNLQLSQNRARAVFNVLLGLRSEDTEGLDALLWGAAPQPAPKDLDFLYELARGGKMLVAGVGASSPYNSRDAKDPMNRRVELLISLNSSR